ncbi:pyruvate formate lyase family protein [Haemophilus parainfluenzae]|uniref:pyruvate formate lyase family protein n=1 Tax=Haemophilus parainfluenzae TaxID=729 RepID=UPI000E08019C|nr:pyruvate formate lyase family protein [Haemophilus parainfluenzae]STO94498.1 Formate acetyltransferase 1 [Haemophilus parainfluenzae ATCC 33392]
MSELNEAQKVAWAGFVAGDWQENVNVRDFIQKNYTPYEGDDSFLAGPTEATTKLWETVMEGIKVENRTHAPLDFDEHTPSTITSHAPGYINKDLEKIVGLQTDAPLKRAIMPFGGIKMVEGSCKIYGRELDPEVKKIFTEYRKTHNQGVFDVYTPDILRCRKSGVLTGLPDAYGRGRIIGDYRRVALYGVDFLMKDKYAQFTSLQKDLEDGVNLEATIRLRENDDLMRPDFNNDDYAIACCVSPMVVGKQMQFFGARANLAKTLLYAINGGIDEKLGMQVGPKTAPITDEVLDFDTVMTRMDSFMDWLAKQYVTALNIIHYMHDKYSYEAALMALHDRDVYRTMACGIAGLSVAADSLSAIKYAKVKPVRGDIKDKDGNVVASNVAIDFEIEGEYPQYGNNDNRVDDIACDLVERFMKKIQKLKTYRNAVPTQSVLTITSNVVYGKKTGNTPDGRRAGAPFGPGANPMHGRDQKGAVASLTSVAKLPFAYAKDGISYTFSIVPNALGKDAEAQRRNLAGLMDGYFHHEATVEGGQHLNVNVLNREMLLDAMENPDKYPQLTIRVSGYAVRFNSLTKEQQQDVVTRTFTESF